MTYEDPRFKLLREKRDKEWQNITGLIKKVVGASAAPGAVTWIEDPEADGIVVHPEHDYHGQSSPFVIVDSVKPGKLFNLMDGGDGVYLFDDYWLNVERVFFGHHAFFLVGRLESVEE